MLGSLCIVSSLVLDLHHCLQATLDVVLNGGIGCHALLTKANLDTMEK